MSTNTSRGTLRPLWSIEPLVAGFRPRTGNVDSFDFISAYVTYADVIEAPPEAHEAVAISLLAAALNAKVYIKHGSLKHSLDLWTLLLSGSGLGRNTLVGLARPVLRESGLEHLVCPVAWGSREAFYQNIAERPTGLYIWPELSNVMKTFNDPRFGGIKEWLTDRYDEWSLPSSIHYRQTGKKSDTPPIEFQESPRLNILATSSFDWFVGSLDQHDSTGGFLPRWMIIKIPEPSRLLPTPMETDASLIKPLAEHLLLANRLEGPADLSEIQQMYGDWYRASYARFYQQPNRALAMPYFNRLRTEVLKLAVVYEVARSATLVVSAEAMSRAFEKANMLEQTIFGLLSTGMNQEGSAVDKISELVRAAGPKGVLQSELTRGLQNLKRRDREDRIHTLKEAATIYEFTRKTAGRSAAAFVHRDHLREHSTQFPHDQAGAS